MFKQNHIYCLISLLRLEENKRKGSFDRTQVKNRSTRLEAERSSTDQSLGHHLTIHDGDVNKEEQNDKEIVHEAQQADHTFRDEVQRGH